jgi:hypothetical protein
MPAAGVPTKSRILLGAGYSLDAASAISWGGLYFGSSPGFGSASGKLCAAADASWLAGAGVTDGGAVEAVAGGADPAADAERCGAVVVLVDTDVRKRRAESSSVVTLPARMSPAVTPGFL